MRYLSHLSSFGRSSSRSSSSRAVNSLRPHYRSQIQNRSFYASSYWKTELNSNEEFNKNLDRVLDFQEQGKLNEAAKLYDKLSEIKPNDFFSYESRGMLHEVFRHWKSAVQDYTKALSLNPSHPNLYSKRGYALMELKDFKNAKKDFSKVIAADTKNVDAYFKRGSCSLLLGEYAEALKDLDKTIQLEPKHSSAYNLRSMCKYAMGDTEEAIDDNEIATRIQPNFISYKNRAQIHESKGQFDEALEFWTEAINSEPKHADLYFSRAQLLKQMGRMEEATKDLDQCLAIDPTNEMATKMRSYLTYDEKIRKTDLELSKAVSDSSEDAHLNRGLFYHRRGKKEEALEDFNRALKLRPTKEIWFRKGQVLYEMGRYAEAAESLTEAVNLDRTDWKAFSIRGKCYDALHKHEEAIYDQTMVINLDSDEVEKAIAHNNRGLVYQSRHRYKEAIEDFDKSIELIKDANCYFNRGNTYRILENYNKAIKDYTEAISIEKNHWDSYRGRAQCYSKLGEIDEALRDFDVIIQATDHPIIYYSRGLMYLEMGSNYAKNVIEDMTKTIDKMPKFTSAYKVRGVAYSNVGRKEDAIADLDKAIDFTPKDRHLYEVRASIHEAFQEHQEAIDDITKAINLYPTSSRLYYYRAQLRLLNGDKAGYEEDYNEGAKIKATNKIRKHSERFQNNKQPT